MSGSEQNDQVAVACMDDRAFIGGSVNWNILDVDFGERQTMLVMAQEVLRRVAEYTEWGNVVQRVCNHPAQIIESQ